MIAREIIEKYLPTIGIECHVQLKTATKLFASVSNDDRGKAPNSTVSPLCFGLPGTLPVLNKKAVELAVRAGHAMNANIGLRNSFDRKHYFYPDLPKGYQITQLHEPIVLAGHIDVPLEGGESVKVRIHHAHLEEDAGKSTHPNGADYSLVDYNRAGTPLLEIVSEPDMHSAIEAKAYAQELYLLMKYANVTLGDLQHGNMRFDVNISVAKKDATELGTRAEIKNLNSFRSVERAVEYEISRQIELLEKGTPIVQETRGWDDAKQKTTSQRSKEAAQDYRYFPEPDVPPVQLEQAFVDELRANMPALPPQLRQELQAIGLDASDAETLVVQDGLKDLGYVSTVLSVGSARAVEGARFAANHIINRDLKYRSDQKTYAEAQGSLATVEQFCEVFDMYKAGELSSNNVDNLLFGLRGRPTQEAKKLAASMGWLQENNTDELEKIVASVLADPANQKAVDDVKSGQDKVIGYLVGQVMKASKGKANPAVAQELIRKAL